MPLGVADGRIDRCELNKQVMNWVLRAQLPWSRVFSWEWLVFDLVSIFYSCCFLLAVIVPAKGPETKLCEDLALRHCMSCEAAKPPRAHHCRHCNRCIELYDHHCHWLGNCIGAGNLKYFFQYCCWTFAGSLYSIWLLYRHRTMILSAYILRQDAHFNTFFTRNTAFGVTGLLFILSALVSGWRVAYLLRGLLSGMTTYELVCRETPGSRASQGSAELEDQDRAILEEMARRSIADRARVLYGERFPWCLIMPFL
mmetsp:Transcript_14859/g.23132  ORF Transcript_14859/g.23132 Transcript_14859/m.23132 type:complete len:255 (-) Transcript_14859:142-906(-)